MYNICMEIWKDIEGFPKYEVSSLGRVRSFARGNEKILYQEICNGYYSCRLNYIRKTTHRLVGLAFIPNPNNKLTVDHINRNPLDNRVENLRWATHSEQRINTFDIQHSTEHRNIIIINRPSKYRVSIQRGSKLFQKCFKTLDDALAWRNKILILNIDERV